MELREKVKRILKRILHLIALTSWILSVVILIWAGIYLINDDLLSNHSIDGIWLIGTGLAIFALMESYYNRDSEDIKALLKEVLNKLEEKKTKGEKRRNTNNKEANSMNKVLSFPKNKSLSKIQNRDRKKS